MEVALENESSVSTEKQHATNLKGRRIILALLPLMLASCAVLSYVVYAPPKQSTTKLLNLAAALENVKYIGPGGCSTDSVAFARPIFKKPAASTNEACANLCVGDSDCSAYEFAAGSGECYFHPLNQKITKSNNYPGVVCYAKVMSGTPEKKQTITEQPPTVRVAAMKKTTSSAVAIKETPPTNSKAGDSPLCAQPEISLTGSRPLESEDGMYVSAAAGSFQCPEGFELVTENLECSGLSAIKWKTTSTVTGNGQSICVTGSAGARPGCFGNFKKSTNTITVWMMQCGDKDDTVQNQFGICKKKDACPAFDRNLVINCNEPKNFELCTFTTCCVDYRVGCETPFKYEMYKEGKAVGRWVDNCKPYHCTCYISGCIKRPADNCRVDFAMPQFAYKPMAPYFYLMDASSLAPGQVQKTTGMPKPMENAPRCVMDRGGWARMGAARQNCYGSLKLEAVPGKDYEEDKSFSFATSTQKCLRTNGARLQLDRCMDRQNAVFTAESDGIPFGVTADRLMGGPFRLLAFREKDKCMSSEFQWVSCSKAAYFYWWKHV